MSAPLEGVVVVALEQAVAAPFATRQLADLGATVVKCERRGEGDFARSYDSKVGGQSGFFVWANRGKQSVEVDIKDPTDRQLLDALIAGADVFVQNLSVAAAERAGVDAHTLHNKHPNLIACDISGYGRGGPRTHDKAYDLAIQAEAGAMSVTGSAEHMSKVGFSVADISAGMYALSSILAALYRRAQTGSGAAIEVSMLESLSEWMSAPVLTAAHTGGSPTRAGHRHALIAPYGLWELSDGRQVLIAVQSDREFASLADQVLDRADLATKPQFATPEARIDNVDELERIIAQQLESLEPDEVVNRLASARVAHAFARTPGEVWDHEQHQARDRIVEVSTPTGTARMFASPFNISDSGTSLPAIPDLGEHDAGVIAEIVERGKRRNRKGD